MPHLVTPYARLKRELRCFIAIGILATLTDFTIYTFLHARFAYPYSVAKALSSVMGTLFNYTLSKSITFKQHKRSGTEVLRFASLYGISLTANVTVNSLSIIVLSHFLASILFPQAIIILAFLMATSVSTVLNFLGQKFWVFRTASWRRPQADSSGTAIT